jgi:hypothetical protein
LAIERETVADSQAILERLRSAESLKLAALDHRMTQVVTEIDAIDRWVEQIRGRGEGMGKEKLMDV